jgi:ribosomal-protein-alanine N-acetyltransferase
MRIELHDGFYLSPVQEGDQDAYLEHFRDKETTDRLLKIPFPYTREDAEKWIGFCIESAAQRARPHQFAVRRADGFLVGGVGLMLHSGTSQHRAELGYWMARDHRGRGVATAGARAMVRYAFGDLGLRRIEATSSPHNLASHCVLEKAGFQREGLLASYHIKDGVLLDVILFAILASAPPSLF